MTLLCERLSFDGPLMGHFIFGVILGGKGEGVEGRVTEAGGLSLHLFTDTNRCGKGSGSL